jgi:hypothetical protein
MNDAPFLTIMQNFLRNLILSIKLLPKMRLNDFLAKKVLGFFTLSQNSAFAVIFLFFKYGTGTLCVNLF